MQRCRDTSKERRVGRGDKVLGTALQELREGNRRVGGDQGKWSKWTYVRCDRRLIPAVNAGFLKTLELVRRLNQAIIADVLAIPHQTLVTRRIPWRKDLLSVASIAASLGLLEKAAA